MKMVWIALIMVVGCFALFAADVEVTLYCDEGYQPYSYAQGGIAKGLYVDVVQKAVSRLQGYKVTIAPVPWKRGLDMVKSGDGFALFPPYYRPKERPWMDYSTPILDEEVVLIVRDEMLKKQRNKWPDDYGDIKIGINSGFSVLKEEEKKKLKIEEAKETRANILKLGLGRIDGYINDKVAMFDTIKNLKASGEYKKDFSNVSVALSLGKEAGYIGYTTSSPEKYPYKDDFKKKLDAIFNEMRKNGEIDKLIGNYTK